MLRELVLRKQLHVCRKVCYVGPSHHSCKHGFPFATQPEYEPILDPLTQRWLYFRPRHEHRNVIPYHRSMLLLWGAHMNIQRVTNSSISHYLLKYGMKSEPMGKLNIRSEDASRLGLQHLTKQSICPDSKRSRHTGQSSASCLFDGMNSSPLSLILRSKRNAEHAATHDGGLRLRISARRSLSSRRLRAAIASPCRTSFRMLSLLGNGVVGLNRRSIESLLRLGENPGTSLLGRSIAEESASKRWRGAQEGWKEGREERP